MRPVTGRLRRAAALAVAAVACSGSDPGSSNDEAPAPSSDTTAASLSAMPVVEMCQLPSGGYTDDCNACLASNCCAEVEACKSDVACGAQLACIIECEEDEDPGACSERCMEPDGLHVGYTPYDDCSFGECRSTCWL